MSTAQTLLFFGIIALTTVFTRALAFVIFPEHKETPRYIQYLGKALPYTIIGLLVVGFRPNLTQASAEAYRPTYPDGQPKPKPQW